MDKFQPLPLSPSAQVDNVLFDMSRHVISGNRPEHTHTCIEIVFVACGSGMHHFNGCRRKAVPGNVYIVLPGNSHAFSECLSCEVFNISCTSRLEELMGVSWRFLPGGKTLFDAGRRTPELILRGRTFDEFHQLITTMYAEYSSAGVDRQMKMRSLFSLCLFQLSQACESEGQQATVDVRISRVVDFIVEQVAKRPEEDLSLQRLAEIACLSRSQLIRDFKKDLRCTPTEYVIDQRIKAACRLLRQTNNSMMVISALTGFRDSNYFARIFKKRMGISPTAFRNS